MAGRLAIIGGSQAYSLLQKGSIIGERLGPVETPFGESVPVYRLVIDGADVLFISRHGETGYQIAAPWVNYHANIWALKELGATAVVAWSGPGAIDETLKIGQYVIPDDLIDETKSRERSFFKGTGWGFVRQNPVFCPTLRSALVQVLTTLGIEFRDVSTYVCTEGPRLETPAEIRKYKLCGGHLVGMTLVPEVFLAKELEMCYSQISYITNYAEGLRARPFQPGVLFEGLLDPEEVKAVDDAVSRFPEIIRALVSALDGISPKCQCNQFMERYKRRGIIGSDWRTWIKGGEINEKK